MLLPAVSMNLRAEEEKVAPNRNPPPVDDPAIAAEPPAPDVTAAAVG